jgi:hypothetical protein
LNYTPTLKDIGPLVEGGSIKNKRNFLKLIIGMNNIIGQLQFIKSFFKYHPFVFEILNKNQQFKKDKGYKAAKKTIKRILAELDLSKWRLKE